MLWTMTSGINGSSYAVGGSEGGGTKVAGAVGNEADGHGSIRLRLLRDEVMEG